MGYHFMLITVIRLVGILGAMADRLLHGSCNSSRGDGSRDASRPVLVDSGREWFWIVVD